MVLPSLIRPEAVNCWVAKPATSETDAGVRTTGLSTSGAVTVTVLVSASVPPCCVAITRKEPAVPPAVYRPPAVMVPPVAV